MSVVVIVKKDNEIVIASDTLTSAGSTKFSAKYKADDLNNIRKFFEYKKTYIGSVGSAMSKTMVRHALNSIEDKLNFNGLDNIYKSLLKLHKHLKDAYYLTPNKGQNDTVENNSLILLIANKSGIYKTTGNRYIAELSRFWAIGSGSPYALGAMHSVYDKKNFTAKDIAKIGVEAACEFDINCALPLNLKRIKKSSSNN